MIPLSDFAGEARRLSVDDFISMHGRWFLLKPPSNEDAFDGQELIGFETMHGRISKVIDADYPSPDPDADWQVVSIMKRPGNPFPRRISVGRARRCDVVLRLPNISKLHATFELREEDTLGIFDADSVNGTTIRGEAVPPKTILDVSHGDRIAFGGVSLRLVDGRWFHTFCREGRRLSDKTQDFR